MAGNSSFVSAEPVRLTLPDGEWIEIKPGFSVGDMKRVRVLVTGGGAGADDGLMFRLAYLFTRLVAWSFTDDGTPVEPTEDAFNALTMERLREIGAAVDRYLEEQEKNAKSGEPRSEASLPSAI